MTVKSMLKFGAIKICFVNWMYCKNIQIFEIKLMAMALIVNKENSHRTNR